MFARIILIGPMGSVKYWVGDNGQSKGDWERQWGDKANAPKFIIELAQLIGGSFVRKAPEGYQVKVERCR